MSHIANENGWKGIYRGLQLERGIKSAIFSLKIYLDRKCATLIMLIVCACLCVCVRAHVCVRPRMSVCVIMQPTLFSLT
jgi:hypothetical protein